MTALTLTISDPQNLVEIQRLLVRERVAQDQPVHSPMEVAEILRPYYAGAEQEILLVLLLNTRNRVLRVVEVVRGSVNSAQVRVGEIFREAVRHNATGLILAHNHPSGDPTPSPDDIALTRQVVQAGHILDIRVLDHIVWGGTDWVSLRERGSVVFSP